MAMPIEYKDKVGVTEHTIKIDVLPVEEKSTERNIPFTAKKRSSYGLLSVVVILLILFIVYSKYQQSPVERQTPFSKSTVDNTDLIELHSDQASRRNLNEIKLFEIDVNRVFSKHKPKLRNAAGDAAEKVSEYLSLSKIVYLLACDKVNGRNETETFLYQESRLFMNPPIQDLALDVDEAIKKLDYQLRRSTLQLVVDLAAASPSRTESFTTLDIDELSRMDIQKSLRNLGYNAVGIGVALSIDATLIAKAQFLNVHLKSITSIASRNFGKQAAKVAGSAAFAWLDGPLPVGDILTLAGILWTGYDIHAAGRQFENEINISLVNFLEKTEHSIYEQAMDRQKAIVREYQKLQDQIGAQTLDQQK